MDERVRSAVGVYHLAALPFRDMRKDRSLVSVISPPRRLLATLTLHGAVTCGLPQLGGEPLEDIVLFCQSRFSFCRSRTAQ